MSRRLITGIVVTLATLAVCYVGVRSELARVDAGVPPAPATADAAHTDPTGAEQPAGT